MAYKVSNAQKAMQNDESRKVSEFSAAILHAAAYFSFLDNTCWLQDDASTVHFTAIDILNASLQRLFSGLKRFSPEERYI